MGLWGEVKSAKTGQSVKISLRTVSVSVQFQTTYQ